jgi:hypothetical protein
MPATNEPAARQATARAPEASRDAVWVRQMVCLHQVMVIVLGDGSGASPLHRALAYMLDDAAAVVVVDCINLDRLPVTARNQLIAAHRCLSIEGRHLIVVNLPESELAPLREHGVDVAATTDRSFVTDPTAHPDRDALDASFPQTQSDGT